MANCPFCRKYFSKKDAAVDHINSYHSRELEESDPPMNAEQALYFSTHNTIHGICMCGCGKETEWNYHTGKPHKVSSDPKCRERLRTLALKNHTNSYGVPTLLNDMEHQREMQHNRPTAGEYKFSDGSSVSYLSALEKNFLIFCDKVLEFSSNMIQVSPETFTYYDPQEDKNRQYDPDFYLPDYNLLIEIKDGGKHPNTNPAFIKETKYKVPLKDEVMKKQTKYNFIKITDRNYGPFVELLYQIVRKNGVDGYNKPSKVMVVLTETACADPDQEVDFNATTTPSESYLVITRLAGTTLVTGVGLTDDDNAYRVYYTNLETNTLSDVHGSDPIFAGKSISIYRYIGDHERISDVFRVIQNIIISEDACGVWDISNIMAENGVYYTDPVSRHSNNGANRMDFVAYKDYLGEEASVNA